MDSKFTVEGLPYDDLEASVTIANRFYKRYMKARTVHVIAHHDGEQEIVHTIEAKKKSKPECPDTRDMFSMV